MKDKEKILLALSKDKVLKKIISHVESQLDFQVVSPKNPDIYFDLIQSIVSQQLSLKAASTIFQRFLTLFNNQYPEQEKMLQLSIEQLKTVGLSFQKASYIQSVAKYSLENEISYRVLNKMSDEEIIQYLTPIKGVGKWTVEMVLMFEMNRLNVFPYDDLIIRSRIIEWYKIEGTSKEIKNKCHEIAARWEPYRSIACRYIWKWNDLNRVK